VLSEAIAGLFNPQQSEALTNKFSVTTNRKRADKLPMHDANRFKPAMSQVIE
jgi:hypothetical protein